MRSPAWQTHTPPPARVAELTGTAAGYEPQFITPVIQPLYYGLTRQLCEAGIAITGPGVAYYEDASGEAGAITVHAALPVGERPSDRPDFRVVELSEIPAAATLIHLGSMDNVLPSIQALSWHPLPKLQRPLTR